MGEFLLSIMCNFCWSLNAFVEIDNQRKLLRREVLEWYYWSDWVMVDNYWFSSKIISVNEV